MTGEPAIFFTEATQAVDYPNHRNAEARPLAGGCRSTLSPAALPVAEQSSRASAVTGVGVDEPRHIARHLAGTSPGERQRAPRLLGRVQADSQQTR